MSYQTKKDRACPHCPGGHTYPKGEPWSPFVDVFRDAHGQPTIIAVIKENGGHVADCDARWISDRLNGTEALEPSEILDALEELAGEDELGEYLPGLAAVVEVLRAEVVNALLKKANEKLGPSSGITSSGGVVSGVLKGSSLSGGGLSPSISGGTISVNPRQAIEVQIASMKRQQKRQWGFGA